MSDAIIKACRIVNTPKNTGKECDTAMVATAMLIAIKPTVTFTLTDLQDPVGWLKTKIHAKDAFPLFGQTAPIREITNDSEGDQIVTLDDGLKVFLRYGLYNRTLATTNGGLCYAAALQSFLNSGYRIIEIDQTGQMLARKNDDGTFSGLITDFMYAPSPIMADFKSTPYKNRFSYSYSPIEFVNNGIIFKNAQALLSMMGLVDAVITEGVGPATTTNIFINVATDCAEDDLVALKGTALASGYATTFEVEDVAALGTPVTITAGVVESGQIKLTGTFVSGHTYRVTGGTPAAWKAANVEGYDASESSVDIAIP